MLYTICILCRFLAKLQTTSISSHTWKTQQTIRDESSVFLEDRSSAMNKQ